MNYDLLIRGGRLIDPANDLDGDYDVAILDGLIAAVGPRLEVTAAAVFNAAGKIVCPGLIDLHMHGYNLVTPLGIDTDHYCLGRGVTMAVDAGSAGASTFPGFRAYAAGPAKTRLVAFLHISTVGLAAAGLGGTTAPGELDLLSLADVESCVKSVEANRDLIVGVKIRLSESICDSGRTEAASLERARDAADRVRAPLMIHHTISSVPLADCLAKLRAGDIYTHCMHGFQSTSIDRQTRKVQDVTKRARERGILFDIGHGQGSFNWTVADIWASEGFWPDTISSDMHSGTCEGPCYDLPTVMTKLLHVGMPLSRVIEAATSRPAQAIGWQDRAGSLAVGREADVSVLELADVDLDLEDCQSQMRRIRQRIVPAAVWRAGAPQAITQPKVFPNPETIEAQRTWQPLLHIRDV
ncbi:MAG: amidohydrolase/deacetylase family metallohydrolase [Bryobacteraceae bacterium]